MSQPCCLTAPQPVTLCSAAPQSRSAMAISAFPVPTLRHSAPSHPSLLSRCLNFFLPEKIHVVNTFH